MSEVLTRPGTAGRLPATEHGYVRRFSLWARMTHELLALSVFGLILTGMPLRFPRSPWARPLLWAWRGEAGAVAVHKVCAVLFFTAAAMHVAGLVAATVTKRSPLRGIFGPDSILPRLQDVRNIRGHIHYLKDEGPRPDYGRFAFWEKFDYLAEVWGLLVIGLSGLAMWFPTKAAVILPGWVLNAALIFHGYEALLAMAFLFTVHFFNTHLRPEVFPVDPAIFTGTVPLHEVRERYPGWYRRLDHSRIELGVKKPSVLASIVARFYLLVGLGILLLVMGTALIEVVRLIFQMLD